jgi:hypothetical protein
VGKTFENVGKSIGKKGGKLPEIEKKLLEMEKEVWRGGCFEYNSRKIKKDLIC